MEPPNCIFCNEITDMMSHLQSTRNVGDEDERVDMEHDFYCAPCKARLSYENEVLIRYSFQYRRFSLVFWTGAPSRYPLPDYSFLLAKMEYESETHVEQYVVAFDFLPNLTPQNVATKLPTILVFL